MLGRLFRGVITKLLLPVGRGLGAAGISPNFLTVVGILIMGFGAAVVASGRTFAGGWVLVGGAIFDTLDGIVAKATGKGSRLGAFLDSVTDRVADGMVMSAVAWHLRDSPLGLSLALAGLVLSYLVSYLKARAEGLGLECNVGIAERAERFVIVAAGLVFGVLIPALGVLVALSFVTVVQRFAHVARQARDLTRS